jgi:arginase
MLNRQNIDIIYIASDLGSPKIDSAIAPLFLRGTWPFLRFYNKLTSEGVDIMQPTFQAPRKSAQANENYNMLHQFLKDTTELLYNKTQNHFPVVIGGEHTIAMATWSGVIKALKADKKFGLIWLDAHMDSHTYETSPSKQPYGMPVATLLGYGDKNFTNLGDIQAKLRPNHIILIGVRDYEPAEEEFLNSLGVRVVKIEEVKRLGLKNVIQDAIDYLSSEVDHFGVSIDLDVFDVEDMPGVTTPVAGGITLDEAVEVLPLIGSNKKLAGIELVEYSHLQDTNDFKTIKGICRILEALLFVQEA